MRMLSRRTRRHTLARHTLTLLTAMALALPAARAEDGDRVDGVVTYTADFFARYQPNSALDMLKRVPGFRIDDGGTKRGFGAAAGNVLIDDRYPSAKQDTPSDLLERIPVAQVQRIELLRSQVRGIDLRGHAVVATVILKNDIPAAFRYDVSTRKIFGIEPVTPRIATSMSDRWRGVQYNAGVNVRRFRSGEKGPEELLDADRQLQQAWYDSSFLKGVEGGGNLNALAWFGSTLLQVNAELAGEDRSEVLDVVPTFGNDDTDVFVDDRTVSKVELGANAERSLHPDLLGNAFLLYTREVEDKSSLQRRTGSETFYRVASSDTTTSEAILRFELDWAGWQAHALQGNIEVAVNVIDSELMQTADDGAGPVNVPVPGANTRVEERRIDLLLSDTLGFAAMEIDYGIGAELSEISQSGDAQLTRRFTFLKPQFSVTIAPDERRLTRFSLAREVSQLDFMDFVSATVFQDDDLMLGNPNLKPQSSWIAELSRERRFGALSVVKATLFHHWISDVEDLLPLDANNEAPGNIGSGRRWGIDVKSTLPFNHFGLQGARFDIEAVLQDSTVTDPVTGRHRFLTGEESSSKPLELGIDLNARYGLAVGFRQDIESRRIAWGWDVRKRGKRTRYKVDELEGHSEGTELNLFLETTRWFGQKIRIAGENLLNFTQSRRRTLYTGERGLTPIDVYDLRNRTDGRRITVSVSGSF